MLPQDFAVVVGWEIDCQFLFYKRVYTFVIFQCLFIYTFAVLSSLQLFLYGSSWGTF